MTSPSIAEAAIREFADTFGAIRREIAKVVIGHEAAIDALLTGFFAGGHVLIEGVPGIGKTLLARSMAEALNLRFARIQFTVDLMPADITGTRILLERESGGRELVFQPGPIFTQVLLADEINRATPKTQSALLEAMAEEQVTVAGTSHPLPEPFFVLATLNPIEMEGTYQLPEAQLDRFMLKVVLASPSQAELERILGETTSGELPRVTPVLDDVDATAQVAAMRRLARHVLAAPDLERYVARLVRATNPGDGTDEAITRQVAYGASPRGGQALLLGAKVLALLDGRPHATARDVDRMAAAALRHRFVLTFAAATTGVHTDALVERAQAVARRGGP